MKSSIRFSELPVGARFKKTNRVIDEAVVKVSERRYSVDGNTHTTFSIDLDEVVEVVI